MPLQSVSPNMMTKPDIDYTTITPEMCVCDVIFNPAETIFPKTPQQKMVQKLSPVLECW